MTRSPQPPAGVDPTAPTSCRLLLGEETSTFWDTLRVRMITHNFPPLLHDLLAHAWSGLPPRYLTTTEDAYARTLAYLTFTPGYAGRALIRPPLPVPVVALAKKRKRP